MEENVWLARPSRGIALVSSSILNVFTQDDLDVFERNCYPKKWSSVSEQDKPFLSNLVKRLDRVAEQTAENYVGEVKMRSFSTKVQLGGTAAKKLYVGCYPNIAPHREYALSLGVFLVGAGIGFSVQVGSAMPIRSGLNKDACAEFLALSQSRLEILPSEVSEPLNSLLQANGTRFRKFSTASIYESDKELGDLRSWLRFASSKDGRGANMTVFWESGQMSEGVNLAEAFQHHCETFAPLIEFVYSREYLTSLKLRPFFAY